MIRSLLLVLPVLGLLAARPAAAQTVGFTGTSPSSVSEDVGYVSFTIQPSAPVDGEAAVSFRTEGISAERGEDFVFAEGRFHWEDGTFGPRSFQVRIVNDLTVEETEAFLVTLVRPENLELGVNFSVEVAILDDDEPSIEPLARIDVRDAIADQDGNFTLYEEDGTIAEITVTLDKLPETTYTLNWASDFPPFAGTMLFEDTTEMTALVGPVDVPAGTPWETGVFSISDAVEPPPGIAREPDPPFDRITLKFVDEQTVRGSCVVCSLLDLIGKATAPCASAFGGTALARDLPDLSEFAPVLAAYRDEVLATTAVGRAYTELYEKLSPDLGVALLRRPTFLYRVLRAQGPWVDGLDALVVGVGDQFTITPQMQADLSALLDEFEELAATETADRLALARQRLQLDSVEGLTMDEFQTRIETLGLVRNDESSWGALKSRYDE